MFVLVQARGGVQSQPQPTGTHASVPVLQEQGEAPVTTNQGLRNKHGEYETGTNCQMERKTQKYQGTGKKRLCISRHMSPVMQNFSM